MAKKMELEIVTKISVEMSDPSAVEDYFLQGSWRECFFELVDLEDFCATLCRHFHLTPTVVGGERTVEGFGTYHWSPSGKWNLSNGGAEEIGSQITLFYVQEDEVESALEVDVDD